MKNNKLKQKLANDKGITLVALVLTITVMIIIISISVNTGTDTLDETKLQAFYTELGIIQKRVDDIMTTNESYISGGTVIFLKEQGSSLSEQQKTELAEALNKEGISLGTANFKFFKVKDLEEKLNLRNMTHDVYIDFGTRTIVSKQGITVKGETYHVLKNQLYFTNQIDKNKTTGIECDVEEYGSEYKIKVKPTTTGDLIANGTLKYRKSTSKYWETVDGLEIIVSEPAIYEIKYTDINNEIFLETIEVN